MLIIPAYFVIIIIIECQSKFESLKVEYYQNLIRNGIQDAASYKRRTDNSDFFQNVTDNTRHDYGEFDFIVIGAGTSGSALTSRLTEVIGWKILLLEAGEEENDLSEIPGIHTLSSNVYKNWGYVTTPQENGCFGMVGGRCTYTRGLSIGGTSAVSGLLYTRGNKHDYNKWAQLGNPGWSYNELLRYFKKSENSRVGGDYGQRGFAGPINTDYSYPTSKFHQTIVDANRELGYKELDYNGVQQIGVGEIQYNTLNGKRVSGGSGYLKTVRNRLNLNVTIRALVTRILLDDRKIAQGVEFIRRGKYYSAKAKKEIIVAGGAINTPQLLMLSGIGPKKELIKHGIKVVQDLPVGKYLKDHIGYLSVFVRTNFVEPTPKLSELVKSYVKGKGFLTKTLNSESISYINIYNNTSSVPNLEYVFVPPPGTLLGLQSRRFNEEITNSFSKQFNASTDFAISVTLLHPKSTGKITLKSKDPKDFPEIDIGIFSAEEDVDTLYRAILLVLKLIETAPFRKLDAEVYSRPKPCDIYPFGSRKFWYCAIKQISFAAHHVTSTTKMGPVGDSLAVVDNNLRVYGIGNLRVVDCGIIPVTISGQLNAIAYVIGEKAADLIKEHYGVRANQMEGEC